MKKLVLIFICLFVSFEVKSEDESALKRYEKIGNFGLKKEIFKVCESFLKLENLDASTEFIMECEHFVKMYNLKGFSSVDSKNMINNLSQDYDRKKISSEGRTNTGTSKLF